MSAISRRYSSPQGRSPRVTHPSATPCLRRAFDLHVLGTPPAFILSQDQTRHSGLSRIPQRGLSMLNPSDPSACQMHWLVFADYVLRAREQRSRLAELTGTCSWWLTPGLRSKERFAHLREEQSEPVPVLLSTFQLSRCMSQDHRSDPCTSGTSRSGNPFHFAQFLRLS